MIATSTLRLVSFLFFIALTYAANTANYENAAKLAGKSLSPGSIYAFKYGSLTKGAGLGHVRLLVLWVEGSPGGLDVKTSNFDQVQVANKDGMGRYFGATCAVGSGELNWKYDLAKKSEYKFLGSVRPGMSHGAIKDVGKSCHCLYEEKRH